MMYTELENAEWNSDHKSGYHSLKQFKVFFTVEVKQI